MSRYFPHTAFEEDQPLAHTILTTHVLARGAQAGALVSLGVFGIQETVRALRSGGRRPASAAAAGPIPTAAGTGPSSTGTGTRMRAPFAPRLLRTTGTGTAVGLGLAALALGGRMWGRELVEWQDRSWRLLENEGQLETDDWTLLGVGLGFAGALAAVGSGWRRRKRRPAAAGQQVLRLGWRGVVGGAGLGSVVGMLGYMSWRYGVHGGKFR